MAATCPLRGLCRLLPLPWAKTTIPRDRPDGAVRLAARLNPRETSMLTSTSAGGLNSAVVVVLAVALADLVDAEAHQLRELDQAGGQLFTLC